MNKIAFYEYENIEIVIGSGMHKFPYHTHNSFMVGVILAGNSKFCINHSTAELSEGSCYVVPSDTGIAIEPIKDFSYVTVCLKNELAEFMKDYRVEMYYYDGLGSDLLQILDQFQTKSIPAKNFVKELIHLFHLSKSDAMNHVKDETIANAVQYINDRCEYKFNLDELSDQVYLSKYYLIRSFKREMGITPKQYHQQCKVRKAKKMLLKCPEGSVAYDLNFSTQSHMGSVFKRYMGITLKDYIASINIK